MEEALAWAEELANKAPLALRYSKQAVTEAVENNLADTISGEARLQHLCLTSSDAQEGVTAFMEKRAPKWQGR
jgi:2-(1,2-epoxy-1,2-dihydrophenyl)acetyl-CoA isomerase